MAKPDAPLHTQGISRMFKQLIGVAACAAASTPAVPASAQSLLDLAGKMIGNAARSRGMTATCEQAVSKDAFLKDVFGYGEGMTAFLSGPNVERAVLLEIMENTAATFSFQGWSGNAYNGDCRFNIELRLAPNYVGELGGQQVVRGTMTARLTKQTGSWALDSFETNRAAGTGTLREYLRPYLFAIVRKRSEQREQQLAAEQRQRADQVTKARLEWIRTHPAEYAEEQRQAAARAARARAASAQRQADVRRRQQACEANGGTWGYRTFDGRRVGEIGCYFQTVN